MMIYAVYEKYYLWSDNKEFVLTNRKTTEIHRGTMAECQDIISRHPYGMTAKQIVEFKSKVRQPK